MPRLAGGEYHFKKKARSFTAFEMAEKALEFLRTESYDIVICDYKLPGMDGLAFLFRLYELQPEALRFITAYANDEVAIRAGGIGIDDFIEKPFTTKAIKKSLKRVLKASAPPAVVSSQTGW